MPIASHASWSDDDRKKLLVRKVEITSERGTVFNLLCAVHQRFCHLTLCMCAKRIHPSTPRSGAKVFACNAKYLMAIQNGREQSIGSVYYPY